MDVLTLHFPPRSQWPGWEHPTLALAAYGDALQHEAHARPLSTRPHDKNALPAELVVVSTLGGSDYASDSPIFLASAKDDPSREYVLKMALRDDLVSGLAAEYIAYSRHLQSLQGGLVPICYGLFVSDQPARADEPPLIGALVLSYVGTPPPVAFPQLPDLVRRQILLALQELHDAGVVHRDLAERNIVLEPLRPDGTVSGPDDFKVHIIDFDAIETGHECPGLEGDPPCEQLTEVVEMFGLGGR